jgi:hypothetical protein
LVRKTSWKDPHFRDLRWDDKIKIGLSKFGKQVMKM